MDSFKEFIEFVLQYKDSPVSWTHIIISAVIITLVFVLPEIMKSYSSKEYSLHDSFIKTILGVLASSMVIWFCGASALVVAVPFGILFALFTRTKYFDFIKAEKVTTEDIEHELELQRLKKKFKGTPYYSILEILLYYGYISPLQKETIEEENIFETPDEMAEKLLNLPVLTEQQLKEAKAIMNIIRIEGKILTRQDALLIVTNMEERRQDNEEDSDS